MMLIGLTIAVGPPGGAVEVRLTVPVNPRSLLSVMVEVLDEPCTIVREDGVDTIEKPGPCTMKVPVM